VLLQCRLSNSQVFSLGFVCGFGINGDSLLIALKPLKCDAAGHLCVKGVVRASAYVIAGMELGSALANQHFTGINQLLAIALYTKPLAVTVSSVDGRALSFSMCHNFTTSNILLLKNPVFSESREVNVLHLDFRKFLTMALCFFVGLFGSSLVNDDFGAS